MSEKHAFVMMIQDRWWSGFCERNRQGKNSHSYVVRGAAPPKATSLILFYVTKPIGRLGGYGEFIERMYGEPEEVWNQFGNESVLKTKEKFEEFIRDASRVSFVRFRNLHEATDPIPLSELMLRLGVRRLSRKGFYVDKESADELVTRMK